MARDHGKTDALGVDERPGPPLLRPRPRLVDGDAPGRTGGAARPPTRGQIVFATAGLVLLTTGLLFTPLIIHHLLFLLFAATALTRLVAAATPRPDQAVALLPDSTLPRYTVIAPLYREAAIAPDLVAALSALDYPADRLQMLIVLESDDVETLASLETLVLPPSFRVLAAPPGWPRTKPRACNIALEQATGDLLTIYDAEDRPHPQQLREAAARFAAGSPRLACLQAPLRIDPDPRLLPAQFALEYAVQFEVLMPALARIGAPFPLGGTSNHFRGIM